MGGSHAPVVTLANSIVGVSVLAMPFCFKQCGILLATLMLVASALITRTVCYFLLKSSILTRRRSYELLAYHTLGRGGKFVVEISMIGFLLGTLVAFLVVMGDLGPQIVASIFNIENNGSLRSVVMSALALFVALPLALLRDIESLSSVSTASFLFYAVLVIKILTEGLNPDYATLEIWRPAGVLQCIPIIAMALSCQTQIFSIYESLPEPSLQKMNSIIGQAVNICTLFYILVGFFGYVAIGGTSGNILLNLTTSWSTDLIKCGFVMSIVFSFPLCVFPCRASLYSLIFRGSNEFDMALLDGRSTARSSAAHKDKSPHAHPLQETHMPDQKIRILTVGIVGVTLVLGLLIPNIELVLGLVGSTAGALVCIIFPSILFLRVTEGKPTTERLMAKFLLSVGLVILCLTTYVTLYAVEKAETGHRDLELQHRHVDAVDLNRLEYQLLKVTSEKADPLNSKDKLSEKKPVTPEPVVPQEFLASLKQQQAEQQKLIEEQKSILEQLQVHVNDHKKEHEEHHRGPDIPKNDPVQIPQIQPGNKDVVENERVNQEKDPEPVVENIPQTFTSKLPPKVDRIDDSGRVRKDKANPVPKQNMKESKQRVDKPEVIKINELKAAEAEAKHKAAETVAKIQEAPSEVDAQKLKPGVNLQNPENREKLKESVKPVERTMDEQAQDTAQKLAETGNKNQEPEIKIPENIANEQEIMKGLSQSMKKSQAKSNDVDPKVAENLVLPKEEMNIQLPAIKSQAKQMDEKLNENHVENLNTKSAEAKENAQIVEEVKNKILIEEIKREIIEKFKNENQSHVNSDKLSGGKDKEKVDRDM